MTLIYIPRTVDDDELAFASNVADMIDTLEISKTHVTGDNSPDDESYRLGWDAWVALDNTISDLVTAMRSHGWIEVYSEGRVAAFARDNLEVNAG